VTPHAQQRIGGWLIVAAIALFLFAIRNAMYLVALAPALRITFSSAFGGLWRFSVLCEFTGSALLAVAAVLLLVLLFKRRRVFRTAAIGFITFLVVFTLADLLLGLSIPEVAARPTLPWRSTVFVVITAGVAVWYLLASQRVKDTFTR
jgi:hypothetical protein